LYLPLKFLDSLAKLFFPRFYKFPLLIIREKEEEKERERERERERGRIKINV